MSAQTDSPAASVPASKPAAPGKQVEDGLNHLMQGKRHLLVKDYSSAVTSLADACTLLAEKYGDLGPECGDPYFCYGKALLELARVESGVIDMNLPKTSSSEDEEEGDDDEKDEDDKDDDSKDSDEASKTSDEVSKTSDEASKTGDEVSKNEAEAKTGGKKELKNGEGKTENGAATAGTSKSVDGEEIEDGDGEEDDGEPTNLQLAWEILEMAKIIYQKQVDADPNNKDTKIRLSEVLLKLGEVGIESENWPTAIDDLQACLAMQKGVLEADDRRLAETYYHLAVAHSSNEQFQESVDSYEKACGQLQLRIDSLVAKRPKDDVIEQVTIDDEIKELKDLLVEMKEKLNDLITEKNEPAPKDDPDDVIKNGTDSKKPASSIAHLIRKKPKAEVSQPVAEKDKTEAKADTEERKRKSEDEAETEVSPGAQKKAKVETES